MKLLENIKKIKEYKLLVEPNNKVYGIVKRNLPKLLETALSELEFEENQAPELQEIKNNDYILDGNRVKEVEKFINDTLKPVKDKIKETIIFPYLPFVIEFKTKQGHFIYVMIAPRDISSN